LIQFSEKSVLI